MHGILYLYWVLLLLIVPFLLPVNLVFYEISRLIVEQLALGLIGKILWTKNKLTLVIKPKYIKRY